MPSGNERTVALAGLGYWGPNLLRNFATSTNWNVGWIVDLDERRVAVMVFTV